MGRNFLIVISVAIIVTFFYFILHPSVITQRKIPKNIPIEQELSYEPENRIELADNSQNVPTQSSSPLVSEFGIKNKNFEQNPPVKSHKAVSVLSKMPVVKRGKRSLEDNLQVCAPYKETMTSEYMGMKMNYSIEIVGWVNNKCVLNFESKMLDAGTTFEDTYGFSPDSAEVFGFAPKVRCEFTPSQLQSVEDSFLLEEKTQNRKMLKDPNRVEIPDMKDMSVSDMKLLKILLGDRACKVVNSNDFVQMFKSLFLF